MALQNIENIENINIVPRVKRNSITFAREDNCNEVILNVHKLLTDLKEDLKTHRLQYLIVKYDVLNVVEKTAELCKVSRSTVRRVLRGEMRSSSRKLKRKGYVKYECDQFCISMIRRVTQEFYHAKTYPTADKIRRKCQENLHFPQVGLSQFRQWLFEKCKFKFRKINKKPVYLERKDIVVQRESYLRSIKQLRKDGYKIYYSDETWASPDQARNKCWHMLLNDSEHEDLTDLFSGQILRDMDNWTGGFLLKSGAGRVIINHIGNEDGFLNGGDDLLICKKDSKDYHSSMNWETYEQWFMRILSLLPTKSVVVVDQAPYHKKRVESTIMPNMAWRKQKIIEWLEMHQLPLPENVNCFAKLNKPSLLQISKLKPIRTKYVIEKLAEETGKDIKVLWLPPAHCEFNPIELVWAKVKGYVAEKNTGGNLEHIKSLCREGLQTVTPEMWRNCVAHAIKYEERMWERDKLMDELPFLNVCEPLVIPVRDDDTTSESDSSSSDDEDYTN